MLLFCAWLGPEKPANKIMSQRTLLGFTTMCTPVLTMVCYVTYKSCLVLLLAFLHCLHSFVLEVAWSALFRRSRVQIVVVTFNEDANVTKWFTEGSSNPPPCRWMELCLMFPFSTHPRCVNSQLVSLLPAGIFNKFLFNLQ